MKWNRIKRGTGLVEYQCEHGVGHPDEISASAIADKHGHDVHIWLVHGCDGCCSSDDFPGRHCKKPARK